VTELDFANIAKRKYAVVRFVGDNFTTGHYSPNDPVNCSVCIYDGSYWCDVCSTINENIHHKHWPRVFIKEAKE